MSGARDREVGRSGAAVRALLRRYGDELADRVRVEFHVHDIDLEMIDLRPRNPRAAAVTVLHRPTVDEVASIGFVDGLVEPVSDYAAPDWPGWLGWMDRAIEAVVAGRVVVREAPGRRRVEIDIRDGEPVVIEEGRLPWGRIPRLGRRGGARVVEFEPY